MSDNEKMKEFFDKMDAVSDKSRNTSDPEEKERLRREFWLLAIDAYNELIAGDITLADGRILRSPPIEL